MASYYQKNLSQLTIQVLNREKKKKKNSKCSSTKFCVKHNFSQLNKQKKQKQKLVKTKFL